jgi:energy-coupling factor transporter ATP-binding protein EcfA2
LNRILQWSADRPNWQRDALRRIVEKGKLDDTDIAELAVLCLAEHSLSKSAATAIPLERRHLPANPGSSDSVTLTEIRDITGVNHLASGQNLTFSTTGLTVVYGDNGSGKSGYARILKRTCRTRNPGPEIMGNIYATPGTPIVQNATIGYLVGGKVEAPFQWNDTGGPHPVLSSIGVFDSSCAAVHIGSRNEIAARPFGLDIPDELAETCKKLDTRLTDEQAKLTNSRHPIFSSPTWKATTVVGKAIAGLTAFSDLTSIRAQATL